MCDPVAGVINFKSQPVNLILAGEGSPAQKSDKEYFERVFKVFAKEIQDSYVGSTLPATFLVKWSFSLWNQLPLQYREGLRFETINGADLLVKKEVENPLWTPQCCKNGLWRVFMFVLVAPKGQFGKDVNIGESGYGESYEEARDACRQKIAQRMTKNS
jgi:hypothetical protein